MAIPLHSLLHLVQLLVELGEAWAGRLLVQLPCLFAVQQQEEGTGMAPPADENADVMAGLADLIAANCRQAQRPASVGHCQGPHEAGRK